MFIHPIHLVLSALAHWANREQAAIIDYLREENRVLRARLGSRRPRFTDAERVVSENSNSPCFMLHPGSKSTLGLEEKN